MFNINDVVVLKSNPSKIGTIHGMSQARKNRTFWPIKFTNSSILQLIPEDQLELYQTIESYTLPDLIGMNKFSSANDVRQIITQTRINGNLSNIMYSMDVTNTDFYAYQFKPVCKIINSPCNSILIADEVGLGKTIEAGLIWTELKQRYDFKRLFIVCPKVLGEKWRIELKNKIGVKAEIVKASEAVKRINSDDEFALICSIQGMASEKIQTELEKYCDDNKELIDMLIIDEAHYLRNPETKAHKSARFLRSLSDYAVFLSATPIQNKNDDLFSLVNILDEEHFPFQEYFDKMLENNEQLVHLRKRLLSSHLDKNEIVSALKHIQVSDRFGIMRNSKQLESLIKKLENKQVIVGLKESQEIAYELDEINSIGYICNRTRKRDVHVDRADRDAIPEKIEMSVYEKELYDTVTEAIHEYAEDCITGAGPGFRLFLLCQPQRMLTSCLYSTLKSWKGKIDRIHTEDIENTEDEELPSSFMQAIYDKISQFKHEKELFENDTKFKKLLEKIYDMQITYPGEKIVLFSSFIPTLEYLHDRLMENNIHSILLTGKVKSKDEVLSNFQKDESIKILLASEVGSEGVDLQFCRLLINYDLPWNPMRVEQRIGRLDRIGQKFNKILIWNLFHDSTIDARIYEKLYKKFEICTSILGDFEEVLGKMFRQFSVDLLLLTPEEQNKRIEQAERAIINKEIENERLENNAAELAAYGDYVLERIQAEQGKKITSKDLASYVLSTVRKLYPTLLSSKTHNENEYNLSFPVDFASDFAQFCERNGYGSRSRILQNYSNVTCSFNNKITASSNSEIINQTHPIINFLRDKTKDIDFSTYPCAAIRINSENKGEYLICASFVFAKGVTRYAKIIYSGFDLTLNEPIPDNLAEDLILKAVSDGLDWMERGGIDYNELKKLASDLLEKNEEKYDEEIQNISDKNFDRAELQKKTLENRLEKERNKIHDLKEKLIKEHKEKMIPAHEGKYRKLEENLLLKLENIEKNKQLIYDKNDICIVLLKAE